MEAGTTNKTERVSPKAALLQARERLLAHGEDVTEIDAALQSTLVHRRQPKNPHPVLDYLLDHLGMINDRQLCVVLNVAPPVMSKVRHGVRNFSPSMAIMAHELTGLSFGDMRSMLGMAEDEKF